MTNPTLEAATLYASLGWRVFPVHHATKLPAVQSWPTVASTNAEQLALWFSTQRYNVGIVTGQVSGVWVLDVDTYHGGDESLLDLEAEFGEVVYEVEALTGGGGRHLFFAWPGFNPGTGAGRLGPGLDIRADGGFVVAAPSVHSNGTAYCWELEHDPHDRRPAQAPEWLLQLCKPAPPRTLPVRAAKIERPTDRYLPTWHAMLVADGATFGGLRTCRANGTQYELWTRPGKALSDGTSATLGYGGSDTLTVHTTNWLPERTYSRFGYYAATRHDGNHIAARVWLDQAAQRGDFMVLGLPLVVPTMAPQLAHSAPPTLEAPTVAPDALDAYTLDWPTFWGNDHSAEDWLAWPVLATGRGHALYAPAKAGKSSLLLHLAGAIATGVLPFGQGASNREVPPRRHVLYCDYEMSESDLRERLEELGYDDATDLTHLHYALLPGFGALDTADGAATLIALAQHHEAELVIVDTFGRAVQGEENSADVVRNYYRLVGAPLKALGIATLRTDHSGKNLEAGMRGSSAKNDDVDIVLKISKETGGLLITRTHSRVTWVPEHTRVTYTVVDDLVHWGLRTERGYRDGTNHVVAELRALGITSESSTRDAQAALKRAGIGRRRAAVCDAVAWLRAEGAVGDRVAANRDPFAAFALPGTTSNTGTGASKGTQARNPNPQNALTREEPPEEPPEPLPRG